MLIKINKPLTFTEIGRKSNQEDSIYPPMSQLSSSTRCFVLCDGMGGHENGEVAAQIVSNTLQPLLVERTPAPDIITVKRFNNALLRTYRELNNMPVTQGKTPGTTMTCLYIAENGVLAAHIGDSRIYQVRPSEGIIFKTSDHSLVNELFRAGELTEEEARNFPRKNVITRAMQPNLERPFRAEISILTDVRKGDYFFMCTDGILENVDDTQLTEILCDSSLSDNGKLEAIYTLCYGNTRDNYTCIMMSVAEVEGEPLPIPAEETNDVADNGADDTPSRPSILKQLQQRIMAIKKQPKTKRGIVIGACALILVIILIIIFGGNSDNNYTDDDGLMIDEPRTLNLEDDEIKFTDEDGMPGNIINSNPSSSSSLSSLNDNDESAVEKSEKPSDDQTPATSEGESSSTSESAEN